MTREEVKQILEEVKVMDDSMYQYNQKYLEALDMAINALNAIDEIIDYLNDGSVTWRDITDDIIADIVNKHMGEQK